MLRKDIPAILLLSFISFLVLSLPGCGGSSSTNTNIADTVYYVDPATGLDTNSGTQAEPFKTLTKAINVASIVASTKGATINAASGVYDTASGEVFPLLPTTGEILIGPDTGTANIVGAGSYTVSGGEYISGNGATVNTSIAFSPGVTGSLSKITANNSAYTFVFADNANVNLSGNTFTGTTTCCTSYAIWIVNGSKVALTSNTITGYVPLDTADASTQVIARNNHFEGYYGIYTADGLPSASQLDLGTAASPGNNTFLTTSTAVANHGQPGDAGVTAVGNTWNPNIQGADADGHYAAQLITGPTTGGLNYYVGPTAGIQF